MRDQKLLFMGAGEAATGISDLMCTAIQADGLSEQAAREQLWLFDSHGLVVKGRTDLAEHKLHYAHDHRPVSDFIAAIEALRPTGIVGVAAVGGTFTEAVLRKMAEINRRPIVFALSNPTSKAECTAEQAYRWTDGRGLFACGSPFDPVTFDGRTHVPRQGNNSYIFPGLGLGAIVAKARRVTDDMFLAAAHTLSARVTEQDLAQGSLYPPLARVRDVSAHIAAAVAEVAYAKELAGRPRPADVIGDVRSHMYDPTYKNYL
jgi:malate dehydrogenase (oxaloacetate-decarboxylating)(NADP+)